MVSGRVDEAGRVGEVWTSALVKANEEHDQRVEARGKREAECDAAGEPIHRTSPSYGWKQDGEGRGDPSRARTGAYARIAPV